MPRSRLRIYLLVRVAALVAFVLAVTVMPRGGLSAFVVVAAGLAAIISSIWSNAGGPGESAGARAQNRWFDSVTPPQGDWPPYDSSQGRDPGRDS